MLPRNRNLLGTSHKSDLSDQTAAPTSTKMMYLAPAKQSGRNLCAFASDGCATACLNTSGRGAMSNVQQARIRKGQYFFENRENFMSDLARDTANHEKRSQRENVKACERLNGTSDIAWEHVRCEGHTNIMAMFPNVQFYDYTKYPYSVRPTEKLPTNYHLTFSRSEKTTDAEMLENLDNGRNVAIVFDTPMKEDLPATYTIGDRTFPVIDGRITDERFLDPKGVIVGLSALAKARNDNSGFVVKA